MQKLLDQFEEEYDEGVKQIKKSNIRKDSEGEVPGKYTAKILYRQDNKRFDREYKKIKEIKESRIVEEILKMRILKREVLS